MNIFAEFLRLIPQTPTYVGTVTSTTGSGDATWATVQIAGGGTLHARCWTFACPAHDGLR